MACLDERLRINKKMNLECIIFQYILFEDHIEQYQQQKTDIHSFKMTLFVNFSQVVNLGVGVGFDN
jgi:hypothetical protein